MEKATIRIRRAEDYFGMVRKLKVLIDDKHVADLKYGQGIDIHVSPDFHTVRVKMDWCTCKPAGVKLEAGERVEFRAETGFDESVTTMFRQLFTMFTNASEFFTLHRQEITQADNKP